MAVIAIERGDKVTTRLHNIPTPRDGHCRRDFPRSAEPALRRGAVGRRDVRRVPSEVAGEAVRRLLAFRRAAGGEMPPTVQQTLIQLVEVEPADYVDARTEARALCRTLGMDVENERWDQAGIGDFIRLAYAQGWIANELRLASIDTSDAIDKAINTPGSVVEQLPGESLNRWTIRAVKQAVAYGVSKEAGRAS